MELLHKSLEEFVEEFKSLYDTDYSHHAVREVYQEHERQRLSEFQNDLTQLRNRNFFGICLSCPGDVQCKY